MTIAFLLGWPAILTSIVLSLVGLVRRRPWLVGLAAIAAAPLAWYLGNTDRFRYVGFILPFWHVTSALLLRSGLAPAAWALMTPFFAIVAGWPSRSLSNSRLPVGGDSAEAHKVAIRYEDLPDRSSVLRIVRPLTSRSGRS